MREVSLGVKAYDFHELACHSVAAHAGLYAERGLAVRLVDTRAPGSSEPDYSVACGAAALRWLGGAKLKVLFVATASPMFWLLGQEGRSDLEELRGGLVATYPEKSPPAHFLRIVLRDAGLEPGSDVQLSPAADDTARLRMLRSGGAAAALLSSATWPGSAAAGLCEIACLGDSIRLPTTGLVASAAALERDGDTAAALQDCFRASVRSIHSGDGILQEALHRAKLVSDLDVPRVIRLIRSRFTADGLVERKDVEPGLRRLARSLGAEAPADPAELYGQVIRT